MKVSLATIRGPVMIEAERFGDWCVHLKRDIEDFGRDYRVSHVPTGYSIWSLVDELTKDDAVAVAKALNVSRIDVYAPDAGWLAQAVVGAALDGDAP